MSLTSWLLMISAALLLSALACVSCAWWYRRKLSDLQLRLDKVRTLARQHGQQAKHQIVQLQKELADRPALSDTQREARERAAEANARKHQLAATLAAAEGGLRMPGHGFADTQPL